MPLVLVIQGLLIRLNLISPYSQTCVDPESLARSGPTLTMREDPNSTNSEPSSARQRNVISMAFRWRADDGITLNAGLVAL